MRRAANEVVSAGVIIGRGVLNRAAKCKKAIGGRAVDRDGRVGFYGEGPNRDARRCLLYTSPSPRDGLLSRMPSSA